MILAGFSNGPSGTLSVSTLAPCTEASIRGTSFWVRVNTRWRLSVMTLENAASGYVARGEPQLALYGVSRFRHSSGENGPGVVHEHVEVWHDCQRWSTRRGDVRFSRLESSATSDSTPAIVLKSAAIHSQRPLPIAFSSAAVAAHALPSRDEM